MRRRTTADPHRPGPASSDAAREPLVHWVWIVAGCPASVGERQLSGERKRAAAEGAFRGMQVCASDRPGLAGGIEGEQIRWAGNLVAIVFEANCRAGRRGVESGTFCPLAGP